MNLIKKKRLSSQCFSFIVMIFVTISLLDLIMVYRFIQIGPFIVTSGAFLMPIYYYLSDVIAEVYGYAASRQVTWAMFLCCIVFTWILILTTKLPSPANILNSNDYRIIFDHLIRATFGGTLITILISTFVNTYILSKWKIMVKGKYFWMRSLGSSAIGELIEVVLEVLILFFQIVSLHQIVNIILTSYVLHIILGLVIIFPGTILVRILKVLEGRDVYDYGVSFNPFKLKP